MWHRTKEIKDLKEKNFAEYNPLEILTKMGMSPLKIVRILLTSSELSFSSSGIIHVSDVIHIVCRFVIKIFVDIINIVVVGGRGIIYIVVVIVVVISEVVHVR